MFCLCKTQLILKRNVQKQFGRADHFTQKLHALQHFATSHHNPFSYQVVELNPAERGLRLSIKLTLSFVCFSVICPQTFLSEPVRLVCISC